MRKNEAGAEMPPQSIVIACEMWPCYRCKRSGDYRYTVIDATVRMPSFRTPALQVTVKWIRIRTSTWLTEVGNITLYTIDRVGSDANKPKTLRITQHPIQFFSTTNILSENKNQTIQPRILY